jgi:hypothetical protein
LPSRQTKKTTFRQIVARYKRKSTFLSKDGCKISVLLDQNRNFEVLNLAMAKVEKFNIAVT